MTQQKSRRQFLASSAAALGIAATGPTVFSGRLPQTADELIMGKDRRLLVLKKFPAVLETPLKLLADSHRTPTSLLFVRNNQQPDDAATTAPSAHQSWTIDVSGMVNQPTQVHLSALREMEQSSCEMVLQCSGNGRSLFSKAAQTSGTQWGRGGMGNVVFSGVKLSTVFEKAGVELSRTAKFVNANGKDEPLEGKEDFLHSLPADDVLNRGILALDLNGKPLSAIHGGPIRLIIPGVFGTMQVKWLSTLDFVSDESENYNHVPRYRVPHQPILPGTKYEFTLRNSAFNWNMKVKSVLLNPNDGDRIPPGQRVLRGVAFNDGSAKITTVLVSLDRGASWQRAKLTPPDSPYSWTQFELAAGLKRGKQPIWCRAIDELGRSQPDDGSVAWNPRGYEWNGIEKIEVDVT